MKKNISRFLLCLIAMIFILFFQFGCKKDNAPKSYTYTIQKPVYKLTSEVLSEMNGSAAEPIKNAGRIYMKDGFIFLNEIDKGLHIIDNTNPSRPQQIAFLNIPGNQDIAVKGNTLYADMYNDLLAIDISDVKHVSTTKVVSNLFTKRSWINGYAAADSNRVIVGWISKDTTMTADYGGGIYYPTRYSYQLNNAVSTDKSSAAGIAGSMAQMVLMENYLYAITENYNVSVVNVSNAEAPSVVSTFFAGTDLETIYPFENKLFLGSSTGMFMYDVSNPEYPKNLGTFAHFRFRDPVVTDGKYAYVTLHGGTPGSNFGNQLDVIDIHYLSSPSLVRTYPMTKPGGLSKDGDLLFICDGTNGVKIYNAGDPANLKLTNTIESKDPYDVITQNHIALVVAKNGIYQYDYSNPYSIRQLSVISVKN